ncbi:Mu-like prophage major head subunit gpT family protein [Vibrio mediterranei]
MQINAQNLRSLYTAVKANYALGMQSYTPIWPEIATLINSNTSVETYAWIGDFTQLREWIGEREVNQMKNYSYTLANKKFEATEGIPADFIEDDQYGVLMPKFQQMGYAAATHPDEKMFELVTKGFTEKCYDGQFFFDTDHPVGKEGAEVSVSNMQAGSLAPWFLLDTSRPLKPFIYQKRKDYKLESKTSSGDSDHVFMTDNYLYGISARGNWGFGFWQMAFGSKLALDEANFKAARKAMSSHKSDNGRPLGITPKVCLVGPSNQDAAEALFETKLTGGGNENPLYRKVKVVVCPWLE